MSLNSPVIHHVRDFSDWPRIQQLAQGLHRPLPQFATASVSPISPILQGILLRLRSGAVRSPQQFTCSENEFQDCVALSSVLDCTLMAAALLQDPDRKESVYSRPVLYMLLHVLSRAMDLDSVHISAYNKFFLPRIEDFQSGNFRNIFLGTAVILLSHVRHGDVEEDTTYEGSYGYPSDGSEEHSDAFSENFDESPEDDAEFIAESRAPDVPMDAHVLEGDPRRASAILPLLVSAGPDQIVGLMTSTLLQRLIWRAEDFPIVGILLEESTTRVRIVFGVLDLEYSADGDLAAVTPHLIFPNISAPSSPSIGCYDLTDPKHVCSFAQFILSLQDHFYAVTSSFSKLSFRRFCWRKDHGGRCPDAYSDLEDPDDLVARWTERNPVFTLNLDEDATSNEPEHNWELQSAHMPPRPERNVAQRQLNVSRPQSQGSDRSRRSASRAPGSRQSPDVSSHASSDKSSQAKGKARGRPKKEDSAVSASVLATKPGSNTAWDTGNISHAAWCLDRLTLSLPRVTNMKENCDKRLNVVRQLSNKYSLITRRAKLPTEWTVSTNESLPVVQHDPVYATCFSDFVNSIRHNFENEDAEDGAEILSVIWERMSTMLNIFDHARKMKSMLVEGRAIYEADSRMAWDYLLRSYYVDKGEIGSSYFLAERKLSFPRNPALDAAVVPDGNAFKEFIEAMHWYHILYSKLPDLTNYSNNEIPDKESEEILKLNNISSRRLREAKLMKMLPPHELSERIADRAVQDPQYGIMDAVLVAPAGSITPYTSDSADNTMKLWNSLFIRVSDAVRKSSAPIKAVSGRKEADEPLAPVEAAGSEKLEDAAEAEATEAVAAEAAEAAAATNMEGLAMAKGQLFLPFLVVEYKKPKTTYTLTYALNQCRQYAISAVSFLEALGINTWEHPVFGFYVAGWEGGLIMACRAPPEEAVKEDGQGKFTYRPIYVLDRLVDTFDLTQSAQLLHVAMILVRLRKRQKEIEEQLSNTVRNSLDTSIKEFLSWTKQAQFKDGENSDSSSQRDILAHQALKAAKERAERKKGGSKKGSQPLADASESNKGGDNVQEKETVNEKE